jgi:hypothetical protein
VPPFLGVLALLGCTRPTPGSGELDAPVADAAAWDSGVPSDGGGSAPDDAHPDSPASSSDVGTGALTDGSPSDTGEAMDAHDGGSSWEDACLPDPTSAPDSGVPLPDAGMTEDAPDWRGDLPVGPVSRGWGLRTDCVHHIFEGGTESIRTSPSSRGFALRGDNPGELVMESDAPTTYPAATLAADGTWYGNGDWGFAVNRWWGSYDRGRIEVTLYGGQTTSPGYFVCHFASE